MRSPMLLRIERPAKRCRALREAFNVFCYILLVGGLLIGLLTGCGAPPKTQLQIVVTSTQAWAAQPDVAARATSVAAEAAEFWGGSLADLDGWTIIIADPPLDCGGGGCTWTREHEIDVSSRFGSCVEAAPIPHEVGHAILYVLTGNADIDHTDPRWNSVRPASDIYCLPSP